VNRKHFSELVSVGLSCGVGETLGQELPDEIERFRGSGEPPNSSKEAVDHALPNV
jgi:hypothetical protein